MNERKQRNNKDEYMTAELALAAGLVSLGYEFLELQGDDPTRLFFVFALDEEIEDLERAFYASKMLVDAQSFSIALRRLKDLIMEHRRRTR